MKQLRAAPPVQGHQVRVLHHQSLPSSLWRRAHIRDSGRRGGHIAVTPPSFTHDTRKALRTSKIPALASKQLA